MTETQQRLNDRAGLAKECAILAGGLMYISGYIINTTFLKNYGDVGKDFFEATHIETGFIFFLSVFTLISPLIVINMISRVYDNYKKSGAYKPFPHEQKLTVFIISNLIWFISFYALLVASSEFHQITGYYSESSTSWFAVLYIVLTIFILIGLKPLRDTLKESDNDTATLHIGKQYKRIISLIYLGCKIALGIIAIAVDLDIVLKFPRMLTLFSDDGQSTFIFVVFSYLFCFLMQSSYQVIANAKNDGLGMVKGSLTLITTLFHIFIFYIVLTSYTFSIYKLIPSNRGGQLLLSQSVFIFDSKDTETYDGKWRGLPDKFWKDGGEVNADGKRSTVCLDVIGFREGEYFVVGEPIKNGVYPTAYTIPQRAYAERKILKRQFNGIAVLDSEECTPTVKNG